MRTTPTPAVARAWDGSYKDYRTPRTLRVAPDSATRLLRTAQASRCTACGNRIEWYCRPGDRTVPLRPRELPAAAVPAGQHWHVSKGLAHPAGDGSPWCRVRHHAICPATVSEAPPGLLGRLHRALAINTRRLTDTATLPNTTNPAPPPAPEPSEPSRPVVQFLYIRYLAPAPLPQILCVAQTRARHRCTHPVLDPDALPGVWTLQPLYPHAADAQTALTDDLNVAVYDLTRLPYSEQLRWRAQRCTTHAATPAAADIALAGWEPFTPHTHSTHVHHDLPPATRVKEGRPQQ
ncbi:DUF6083 domain-containing protein [Streptomyces sp. XD-27]|uniref:DUF6083 domain-containing protein n=1 Tax=Streptomyces sp. XD-27 TaxID=3062779 RepID=UPI0026F46855|nr:DUF6083 domain-containing protein [Streptomyces sp. XD-27]WKX68597.1 DUF6083 domain-containing protein [Streptomyces sp. XD-27]